MKPRRELIFASEGIPILLGIAAITVALGWFYGVRYAVPPFVILVVLLCVFRDPARVIPTAPLGVASPVDGTVIDVATVSDGPLEGDAHCVRIRVNAFGAYTARAPVEGKVMELHRAARPGSEQPVTVGGLWIRTDEGEDVVLQFHDNRFGLPPGAFLQYGERIGQGERCAFLRLTRVAEIQFPGSARVLVGAGDAVVAGSTLIARLSPH